MKDFFKRDSKQILFVGSVLVAFGVVITTTLPDSVKPLGIVLIAIGGLIFIKGMAKRKNEEKSAV